jgi:NitT/TauT family transport system ATP-binding protein
VNVIALKSVTKGFDQRDGTRLVVLDDIDLDIPAGEIVALLGESGCGKSTLLNIVAGLCAPDRGAVYRDGVPSNDFRDWRAMTYMFQDDRLLPWRTAARNVAIGLEAAGVPRAERRARVRETLDLVGLSRFADLYPHELSGGMRSRVALARSIVTRPSILLMDEPFSKLDPTIRARMHDELLRITAPRAMTVVFVTHDVEEAVVLANRVVVMQSRPGRIRETWPITLPYPRDPLAPAVSEAIRGLRLALAGKPVAWVEPRLATA